MPFEPGSLPVNGAVPVYPLGLRNSLTPPSADPSRPYQNFLKTHRWEQLFLDILANGAASAPVTADLPRTFWEVLN
jgi:hypothetical protein